MARPFLLAQLSDPHIGADWDGADPVPRLAAAVRAVAEIGPDAVLVTGDLSEHADAAEYALARELLEPLRMPLHVLGGNHDDRAGLRRAFGLPGEPDDPVQQAIDLGPLRLVTLDSTCPGEDGGELDEARLDWLDAALAEDATRPTVLALHHPPLATGVPAMDAIGLPGVARSALAALLARHVQVRVVVAGHVHRTVAAPLAGRPVLAVPSTYRQLRLDFAMQRLELGDDPAGFAVHALEGDELTSHVRHQPAGS